MECRCIMCAKRFRTLDSEPRLWCSVGCNIDWAQDKPSFDQRVNMPRYVDQHPCIELSNN